MADEGPSPTPNTESVNIHMLFTTRHSCNVEYFLDKLGLGSKDPERPHDIVGLGNKFEYSVIMGLALVHEDREQDDEERYKVRIYQARDEHRQQYHHRKWNNPHPDDDTKPFPGASEDDMLVGAVDTVCALLEGRSYQAEIEDYEEVLNIARGKSKINCEVHKRPWVELIAPEMQKIKQPSLDEILAVRQFPNIGLPKNIYERIMERSRETADLLSQYNYKIK